jgi:hypothetical protein
MRNGTQIFMIVMICYYLLIVEYFAWKFDWVYTQKIIAN